MPQTQAMMKQEAEVLVARLTRIWAAQMLSPMQRWSEDPETLVAEVQVNGYKVCLYCVRAWDVDQEIRLCPNSDVWDYWMIAYFDGLLVRPEHEHDLPSRSTQQQFEEAWLQVFRRNCWLSGIPLEASAHKKAEWMQGFTAEELQAWNLKI